MALNFVDRLLTIAVTATLTSAAWIVVGSARLGLYEPDTGPRDTPESGEAPRSEGQDVPAVAAGLAPGDLAIPVRGIAPEQLTDSFADERAGGDRLHEALDIAAPAGTAVVAAAPGVVERLFRSAAGGSTIYVRSPDRRTIHYYAHLRDYAAGLREGQEVARGERLGSVGATGNADPAAPHLHFAVLRTTPDAEWWEPATALNPYPLLSGK